MGRSRPYAARVHVLLDVALHNVVPARHPRVSLLPGPLVHPEHACCAAGAGKRVGAGDAVARTCVLLSVVRPWRTRWSQVLALLGRLQRCRLQRQRALWFGLLNMVFPENIRVKGAKRSHRECPGCSGRDKAGQRFNPRCP